MEPDCPISSPQQRIRPARLRCHIRRLVFKAICNTAGRLSNYLYDLHCRAEHFEGAFGRRVRPATAVGKIADVSEPVNTMLAGKS